MPDKPSRNEDEYFAKQSNPPHKQNQREKGEKTKGLRHSFFSEKHFYRFLRVPNGFNQFATS